MSVVLQWMCLRRSSSTASSSMAPSAGAAVRATCNVLDNYCYCYMVHDLLGRGPLQPPRSQYGPRSPHTQRPHKILHPERTRKDSLLSYTATSINDLSNVSCCRLIALGKHQPTYSTITIEPSTVAALQTDAPKSRTPSKTDANSKLHLPLPSLPAKYMQSPSAITPPTQQHNHPTNTTVQ